MPKFRDRNYSEVGVVSTTATIYSVVDGVALEPISSRVEMCARCGCLVVDVHAHDAWHGQQEQAS